MARSSALRPNYLDASALVKLVIDEEYSDRVRSYLLGESWRVCTSYCFVEAMAALKLRHQRCELSDRGYIAGCRRLMRLEKTDSIKIIQADFPSKGNFGEAERIVRAYGIDFLDAFQLISVRDSWGHLASPSHPILVTADGGLFKAAQAEGIKSWYCRESHRPNC